MSRTAGWISAVVLVGGSVAGTWTHTLAGKRLSVAVTAFQPLPARVRSAVRLRAGEIAEALDASSAEVTVG